MKVNRMYLTVEELSCYIGRSKGAIYNLVSRRLIPFRKVCGRLLFPVVEIDRWVGESEGIDLDEIAERDNALHFFVFNDNWLGYP